MITPRLARITVTAPDLSSFPRREPDQCVKLFFPLPGQPEPSVPALEGADVAGWYRRYLAMPDDVRPGMRSFTVRRWRPERAELDIDFVLHGDTGLAGRWATAARPGDPLGVLASVGQFDQPENAPWLLVAGDHSALPAIGAILESLHPSTRALVFVELDDPADEQLLHSTPEVRMRWAHRANWDSPPGEALVTALRHTTFPLGAPYAWLAGEAGLVRTLRRHLVNDRGIAKPSITFTGYWRHGKAESDGYSAQELAELNG